MPCPMVERSSMRASMMIRPRMVPIMPKAGACLAKSSISRMPFWWRAWIWFSSLYRMFLMISGSVPSTTSWMPFRKNSSSSSSRSSSRASRPSRRAFSEKVTSWLIRRSSWKLGVRRVRRR